MQAIVTVKTFFVGDHPGIIPVKFGQNPMTVSEENMFK